MLCMHSALRVTNRSGLVLDVGANKGQFSIPAMRSGRVVHAFEPHPRYHSKLFMLSLWSLLRSVYKPGKLFAHRIGLSKDSGKTILYNHPSLPGAHSIISGKVEEDDIIGNRENTYKKYCIKTMTLDSWAASNHIRNIGFIKVDIEGAEADFLSGGIETIKRDLPDIFLEVRGNPDSVCGETIRKVFNMLVPLGYNFYFDEVLSLELKSEKLQCSVENDGQRVKVNYSPSFLHGDIFFSRDRHNDSLLKI